MIYRDFQGEKLSMLGFGTMRLPLLPGGGEADIDQAQVDKMTDYAIEHGVNYFDTAYPYHGSCSEIAIGRALARHPRDKFNLADKYPGHQIYDKSKAPDPAAVFADQLKKCGVEYFDFYLMHNVSEPSIKYYLDGELGIVDFFVRQKELGKIRHLGFSSHGSVENTKQFLDACGEHMEFCQIQLNYLDWSLQDAEGKYKLLTERGIPVWVMEPVRGGKLAKLDECDEALLRSMHPDYSTAAWGFRWLQGLSNVTMVLSGMSSFEQMVDNVKNFDELRPLSAEECNVLYGIADKLKNTVPCTGCRYCCKGCPQGLDIPMLLNLYNDLKLASSVNVIMRADALPEVKRPEACIGCGRGASLCPLRNITLEEKEGRSGRFRRPPRGTAHMGSDLPQARGGRELRQVTRHAETPCAYSMRMVFFRSFILFHIFLELLKAAVGIHGDVLVFPVYHAVGDEKNAHAGFLRGHVLGHVIADHQAVGRLHVQLPGNIRVIRGIGLAEAGVFIRCPQFEILRLKSCPADGPFGRGGGKNGICRKGDAKACVL